MFPLMVQEIGIPLYITSENLAGLKRGEAQINWTHLAFVKYLLFGKSDI